MEENLKNCCGQGDYCKAVSWKNPKTAIVLIGVILLAGIITVAILRDRIVNQQFKSVTITGQGKLYYNPDLAIVTLGVQIDKVAKPEEALNQLNAKVNEIIKAVKVVGVGDAEIQTQNYSLYPQYDYKDNISTVSGYNANEQLVIKIVGYDQDQDKLSRVIAAAGKAGANQINNLVFDASNLNDLKQQARVKAIEDAKGKSAILAETAGVKLKEVIGWYENFTGSITYDYYAKGGMGAGGMDTAPQVPAGSREIIVEVGVTYSLK